MDKCLQANGKERPLLILAVRTSGARNSLDVTTEVLSQSTPFIQSRDSHDELLHGPRLSDLEAKELDETRVDLFPEPGDCLIPFHECYLNPSPLVRKIGCGRHCQDVDPQRPTRRVGNGVAVSLSSDSTHLPQGVCTRFDRREIDTNENVSYCSDRQFGFGSLLVLSNGNKDIGLVVRLVLPHTPDYRGVRKP